ncbi:unnamed protein product [Amoebophrya sp. A25]|nr:unnamed protein product [Amoebophrya sp. A25]|eukprot:GSA25T00025146001.1
MGDSHAQQHTTPSGGGYFDKKGEINELRTLLRQVMAESNNEEKRRDALKKVIAYMTLGIDVSRLFSDVVMASHTQDVVQKKMIYLYLTNYAESNGELALLAINTLQKDCRDEDPTIRGLALRSLCSLKLPDMLEYLEPAAVNGLRDASGYVRKSAVVGILKIFHLSPISVRESDEILDRLYALVADPDGHVATNAIFALEEILKDCGGMTVNKPLIEHLLNRLNQLPEWGQSVVLHALLTKYDIATEAEMYDVMNLLEPLLKQSSASVIISVAEIFLHITQRAPLELQTQVLGRLKGPLLTLVATNSMELGFAVLSHIHCLLSRMLGENASVDPLVLIPSWIEDYKQFFVKWNDFTYVKRVKLDILCLLVVPGNAATVISEIRESVTDLSSEISKHAIQCLGNIALRCPENGGYIGQVVQTLLDLLQLGSSGGDTSSTAATGASGDYGYGAASQYVVTETAVVMKDILRKYPEQFAEVGPSLERVLESVEGSGEGKAALVWMLGEFGSRISEGPYLLEPLIEDYESLEPVVKGELLIAAAKLFFARPRECQILLGKLLDAALKEERVDLRDRALLYYRLLLANAEEAKRVICGTTKQRVKGAFQEDVRAAVDARIFREFNTLSVIYKKPAAKFCTLLDGSEVAYRGGHVPSGPNIPKAGTTSSISEQPPQSSASAANGTMASAAAAPVDLLDGTPAPPAAPTSAGLDLLGVDDSRDLLAGNTPASGASLDILLDGGGPASSSSKAAPGGFVVPPPGQSELAGAEFEETWTSWPVLVEESRAFNAPAQLDALDSLVQSALEKVHLQCLASGFLPEERMLKFYLYGFVSNASAEQNSNTVEDLLDAAAAAPATGAASVMLVEILLQGQEQKAQITVKGSGSCPETAKAQVWEALRPFL